MTLNPFRWWRRRQFRKRQARIRAKWLDAGVKPISAEEWRNKFKEPHG